MPTVWGSGGGGPVLVVDGLGSGMVEAAGYDVIAIQLLPHGQAWSRRPSSTTRKVTAALSRTFARLEADLDRLSREIFPSTCDESIADWEAFAGLPHACDGDPPTSLEDRRAALVAKLFRSRGLLDLTKATAIAGQLGYTSVEGVETFRPFRCGSKCGHALAGHAGGWPWHALLLIGPPNPDLDATLRCLIRRAAIAPFTVTIITS